MPARRLAALGLALALVTPAPILADDAAVLPPVKAPKVGDRRACVRRFTTTMTMTIRSPGREADKHESSSIARSRVLATVRDLAADGSVEGLALAVRSRRRLSPTVGGETDPLASHRLIIAKGALKSLDGAAPSLDAEDAWKLDRDTTPFLLPDLVSGHRGKALPADGRLELNPAAIKAHLELRSGTIRFKTCEAKVKSRDAEQLIATVTLSAVDERENAPRLELEATGELRISLPDGRLSALELKGTLGLSEDRMGRSIRGAGELDLKVRFGPPALLETKPETGAPKTSRDADDSSDVVKPGETPGDAIPGSQRKGS